MTYEEWLKTACLQRPPLYAKELGQSAWDHQQVRIGELESALKAVHTDLLLRGEKDSDGRTVVSVGFSVWIKVCDALEPKNNQAPHIQE